MPAHNAGAEIGVGFCREGLNNVFQEASRVGAKRDRAWPQIDLLSAERWRET
jgi:hypothetical protein